MIKERKLIGSAEHVDFPELKLSNIPARIDTGAQTSAIWASNIQEKAGAIEFNLFDRESEFYTGDVISTQHYEIRTIASSNGASEQRYAVKFLVVLEGRRIRASFSLANRATQVYPVLVGRNVLRGKFVVDVKLGKATRKRGTSNSKLIQSSNHRKGA
mgnify:CR=1 FL=1